MGNQQPPHPLELSGTLPERCPKPPQSLSEQRPSSFQSRQKNLSGSPMPPFSVHPKAPRRSYWAFCEGKAREAVAHASLGSDNRKITLMEANLPTYLPTNQPTNLTTYLPPYQPIPAQTCLENRSGCGRIRGSTPVGCENKTKIFGKKKKEQGKNM